MALPMAEKKQYEYLTVELGLKQKAVFRRQETEFRKEPPTDHTDKHRLESKEFSRKDAKGAKFRNSPPASLETLRHGESPEMRFTQIRNLCERQVSMEAEESSPARHR